MLKMGIFSLDLIQISAILKPGYLNSPNQMHLNQNILFSSGLSGSGVSITFLSTEPKQWAPFRQGVYDALFSIILWFEHLFVVLAFFKASF